MSAPPPADLILTEEMIAAGVEELRKPFVLIDLADGFISPEEIVAAIYRAMKKSSFEEAEGC